MTKKLIVVILLLLLTTLHANVNKSSGNMSFYYEVGTADGNSISLPVNLQYSAGITIDQRASWAGLGFDISLPYIDRVPNGSVDEKAGEFRCNGSPSGEYWRYSEKDFDRLLTETGNGYFDKVDNPPPKGNFTNQQDFYYLSAPFASGRILFATPDDNNQPMVPYLQNWKPIKIEYEIDDDDPGDTDYADDDICKWVITNVDGIRYIFGGAQEQGIVRAQANIADDEYEDNTATTMSGVNGNFFKMSLTPCTGMPEWCQTEVKTSDHYVNEQFNRRWYLTEIQSADYDAAAGTGEHITINYTARDESYDVKIDDYFYFADYSMRGATSLFRNKVEVSTSVYNHFSTFSFGHDNYSIYPVYPVDIIGPVSKVHFEMTPAPDIVKQGDKRIAHIDVYNGNCSDNYTLDRRVSFRYADAGLCLNHPYSPGGSGRSKLIGIDQFSQDLTKSIPVVHFEYASNPDIPSGNFLRHDFFGYYSDENMERNCGAFIYPDGQSYVGDADKPGAEAWSVSRIIYSSGKVVEYEYEPNKASVNSVNATFATAGRELKPGIRVKKEIVYDGISSTPIITEYEYDQGYIGYRSAIGDDIESFYATLNDGEYASLNNIMVLKGTAVQYGYCKTTTASSGSVETYFLTPADYLPKYGVSPVSNLYLSDVFVDTDEQLGLNNLAHCRGASYKKVIKDQNGNILSTTEKEYAVEYNTHNYIHVPTEANELSFCVTATPSPAGDPPEILFADNVEYADYVGFLRLMRTVQTNGGVETSTEVLEYNNTNASPTVVCKTNSDGKRLLTKTSYAYLNMAYPGMGEDDAHMLIQPIQTVTYEKPAGSTDNSIQPENVRAATAITYSNTLGNGGWIPYGKYSFNVAMQPNGLPDPTKPFVDFYHTTGTSNANWSLKQRAVKYSNDCRLLEVEKPGPNNRSMRTVSIYGDNVTKITGSVANAAFEECGVFTGDYHSSEESVNWLDKPNGWEKGANCSDAYPLPDPTVEIQSVPHFGEASVYVKNAFGPSRNFRLTIGRDYLMTAWVKVVSGKAHMNGDYRYKQKSLDTSWPVTGETQINGTDFGPVEIGPIGGKWVLIQMEIPAATQPSSIDWDYNNLYARVFVGAVTGGEVYIDDIRFAPKDAMVSSTYYDKTYSSPIITIDANNNPGKRVVYDIFSRPVAWYKVDPALGADDPDYYNLRVQEKEYHIRNQLAEGEKIKLLTPDGKTDYTNSEKLIIRWINKDDINVSLFHRIGTGSWQTAFHTASYKSGINYYEWEFPTSLSGNCFIKIEGSDGSTHEAAIPFSVSKKNQSPNVPIATAPASCEENVALSGAVLTWTGGDPESDAVDYDVYFGSNAGSMSLETTTNTLSHTLGTLTADTDYYWKIIAEDINGNVSESSIYRFKTLSSSTPPNEPHIISPADKSTGVAASSVTLSWTGSDPDGDALTYDVYLAKEGEALSTVATNRSTPSYTSNLESGKRYYWKIAAKDDDLNVTESVVFSFVTYAGQYELIIVSEKMKDQTGSCWINGCSWCATFEENPIEDGDFTPGVSISKATADRIQCAVCPPSNGIGQANYYRDFDYWEVQPSWVLTVNAADPNLSFTMPDQPVKIIGKYVSGCVEDQP